MARRMSAGMQAFNIGRMLSNTRWNNEMFDVSAHIDRSLHYDENVKNVQNILGIQTRNRGMEHLHQTADERQRERVRRKDTSRQTGPMQGDIGRLLDMRLQAMRPGKRISRTGHRYYERRENRSDRGKLL